MQPDIENSDRQPGEDDHGRQDEPRGPEHRAHHHECSPWASGLPPAFYASRDTKLRIRSAGRAAEAPHPFFEQLVAETRKPNGVWEKTRARNEALDLMVGAHVLAHLNGLARINWDRPPSWAAA